MNWFLLLLFLKPLTVNWAAPIDLFETNNELQKDKKILDNTFKKTSDTADEAKNIIKTLENLVNSTENTFKTSSPTENLDETVRKVSQNFQNLTGGIRNKLEQSPVNISENRKVTEESKINNSEIIISDVFSPNDEKVPISSQNPVESLTEYIEALQDTKHFDKDNEYQQFTKFTNAPEYISSTSSIDVESEVTDNYFVAPENKKNLQKITEIPENIEGLKSETRPVQNLPTSHDDTEHVTTQSSNIVEQTSQDLKSKKISITQSIVENLNENLESLQEPSQKRIENVFDYITEHLEPSASETDFATVRNTDETLTATTHENKDNSYTFSENFTEQPRQNAEQSIAPKNNDGLRESTNLQQGKNSDKPHSVKENIDSLLNQVADNDSNIQNESKKFVIESSVIQEAANDSNNSDEPINLKANITEMPVNQKQAPIFISVVDSFIEDIVEIGSKLGLIPEEKQNVQISTTTENFSEPANTEEGSSTTSISSIEQSLESQVGKIKEITLTLDEPKTTTSSPLVNFNETQESHTEMNQYSKNFTVLKETTDSLINQVADIDSNIHKGTEKFVTESSVITQATDDYIYPDSAITTKEYITEMPVNIKPDDMSVQLPSFTTAVDAFIDDIVEIGSNLGFIPEVKQNEHIPTSNEMFTEPVNVKATSFKDNKLEGEGSSTTSISSIEQSLESQIGKITLTMDESKTTTASPLENFNESQENHTELDQYTKNSTLLKEATNSLINQVADIDSNIHKGTDKFVNEFSVTPQATDDSIYPDSAITTKEYITEIPHNIKPDDMSVQLPSFTTAVDAFIDDIVEIGSNLGLIPEVKQNEQIPTSTEMFTEPVNVKATSFKDNKLEGEGSSTTSISSIEQSLESQIGKIKEITLTMDESKTTTASPLENFNETQESHTEMNQYSKNLTVLKTTTDSLINHVADIDSNIHKESEKFATEYSVIPEAPDNSNNPDSVTITKENITEMPVNIKPDDMYVQLPSFTTAVDAFIDDIVEIGSNLGLIPEVKQNEQIPTSTEMFTEAVNMEATSFKDNKHAGEGSSTTSISSIEQSLESQIGKIKEITLTMDEPKTTTSSPLVNFNETQENHTELDQYKKNSTFLKETIDSLINHVANIDSNIHKESEKLVTESSVIPQATDNFINSDSAITTIENITEIPHNIKPDDTSVQAPRFTTAVDSLIEDIVEIGSKLSFTPEVKQNKQIPTTGANLTTPVNMEAISLKENKLQEEGTSATPISSIEDSSEYQAEKIKDTNLAMDEQKVTTFTPLEKINETHVNYTEINQYSKNSNFTKSLESVADAILEIGSNIGKTITDFSSQDKSNESLTEIASSEQQNIMENPTTALKLYTKIDSPQFSNEESTKTLDQDRKSKEIPATTQAANGSFSNPTENVVRTFYGNVELRESNNKEILGFESPTEGKVEKKFEEDEVKLENHPAKYVDYIPLEVIANPESEVNLYINTTPTNEEIIAVTDEIQESQAEVAKVKLVEMETFNKEEIFNYNITNDSENTSPTSEMPTTIKEPFKAEDYTTSSPLIREIFPSLNKFETTLKTLIEKGKFKQEEIYNTNLEHQQLETSTSTPNTILFTTLKDELTTITPIEETTVLPKKFEEELQMAVKALEETTHHHFEEFQNHLKEAIKKFTVWGAEHERQEETSTLKNLAGETTTTESETRQQFLKELSTTMKPEEELTSENNVQGEESVKLNEPNRSGAIRQNFDDKFAVNYKELQAEKQLPELQEKEFRYEHTTETPKVLTTILPTVMEDEVELNVQDAKSLVKITTIQNEVAEATTVQNTITDKSTSDVEQVPTEYIAETTTAPLLARVSLQKDTNSFSLNKVFEIVTEVTTKEPTTQKLDSEQKNNSNSEFTLPTQPIKETITLQTPDNSLQEMVTFIEHTETTTNSHPIVKEEVKENFATAQTQVSLTQASFMKQRQQQIASTTEHEAQTQTAAANGQAATIQQQTTEAEIYSTTGVEETETTVAPVEPEARSLSLPPPKLEYLQNEDGVEVFYGYSIVKRN